MKRRWESHSILTYSKIKLKNKNLKSLACLPYSLPCLPSKQHKRIRFKSSSYTYVSYYTDLSFNMRGMNYLRLVLLLLLSSAVTKLHCYATNRYVVHIVNGLSSVTGLYLHCKSKEDDLGEHQLYSNAEFNLSFGFNFWCGTVFWCNLNWGVVHHGDYRLFWNQHSFKWKCSSRTAFGWPKTTVFT